MNILVAITSGGAMAAFSRYPSFCQVMRRADGGILWGALIVNLASSFVLGVLVIFLAHHWSETQKIGGFLAIGVLGSLTTFSAFSLDAALLLEQGHFSPTFADLLLFRQVLA